MNFPLQKSKEDVKFTRRTTSVMVPIAHTSLLDEKLLKVNRGHSMDQNKILYISGSPRKESNTDYLLRKSQKVTGGEFLKLIDYEVKPCDAFGT